LAINPSKQGFICKCFRDKTLREDTH